MNFVLRLSPKENYFTEELVGILWTEFKLSYLCLFKLFIWNWKRFDLYFPLLRPKKGFIFFEWRQILVKICPWSYLPMMILHWRTVRYLMNWIQVVYFKLNEIWPLFSTATDKKKQARFLHPFRQSKWKHESMKANLSQKALKLGPNDNYFTEVLIVNWIQVVYFKLKGIFPC